MCSYNRVNEIYSCENHEGLQKHLRQYLNFTGWVMSDWFAMTSTNASFHNGLDVEMPVGYYYRQEVLKNALHKHEIEIKDIDAKVLTILTTMNQIGLLDTNRPQNTGDPHANVTSDAHNLLAREIAAKSTVLLKNNNNLLPLTLASITANADDYSERSAGTTSTTNDFSSITSMIEKLSSEHTHTIARKTRMITQQCIAVIGDTLTITGEGSGKVIPPYIITPQQGILSAIDNITANTNIIINVKYSSGHDINQALTLAKTCSIVIIVVAVSSKEGADRLTLSLGDDQNNLIKMIAETNHRVIVNIRCPGAVLMPWADLVPVIVVSWLPGSLVLVVVLNLFVSVFIVCKYSI